MRIVASTVGQDGSLPSQASIDSHPSNPLVRWNALALVTAAGRHHRLIGNMEKPSEFTDAQSRHLASGKAVIWIEPGSENRQPRIFMSALVDPRRAKPDLIVGEINQSYLWVVGNSRILPDYITPCVIDLSGSALMCSFPAESLPEILKQNIRRTALGDFDWSEQGRDFFASYWTVPAKFEFDWPGCAVVLRTSKDGVFASIAELEATFLLWVTVCLGASILIASYQIRTRLVPVEKLQEATQRIAAQDFAFRAKVGSGDEFEELAVSINAMAAQLGQQFETLTTKAAIDRAVLSLLDTSKIAETILTRIMSLLSYDRGTMTLFGDGERGRARTFLVEGNETDRSTSPIGVAVPLPAWNGNTAEPSDYPDPIAVRAMVSQSIELSSGTDNDLENLEASYLQRHGFKVWLSMPLIVNGEILCVMVFYAKDKRSFTGEEMAFVKNFTGQAAIAIYNSRLFEQTKEQAAELKKANQAKDDFLSIVSHELRTPLNIILGYVRLVRDKVLGEVNPDQEKALATVNRHSTELLAMIDSVMEATLIQAGTASAVNRPSNVCALLDALKTECTIPDGKNITIQWRYPAELPLLMTDERKLRRIVQNLVANAIKFTETGSVTVSVSHLADNDSLEINVADTGIGMPAESLPKIFDLLN
ncbi:MAG: ATP-binding protein, partial [Candidatus Binatia bacterium]